MLIDIFGKDLQKALKAIVLLYLVYSVKVQDGSL